MGYLIAFGIIVCFGCWPVGVAIIASGLVGIIITACRQEITEVLISQQIAERQLIKRADRQNAAWLSGDPYGTYGEYPPAA